MLKRPETAIALFNLLFVAACSSTGGAGSYFPAAGNKPIQVESVPSGAEVYVMGKKIGVTPLEVSRRDVFPNTYPRDKESVYGRIVLKKEGCSDYTRTVSAEISNTGLHAQLDCGNLASAPPVASGDESRNDRSAEQRLGKIKDLLNKGLITDEEAKKARERILNEL